MKKNRLFVFMLSSFAVVLCAACQENRAAVLWTTRPELAVYAQQYNTVQNKYKIEVLYVKSPLTQLEKTKQKPDIFIADFLNHKQASLVFKDISPLLNDKSINKETFYPALLEAGRDGNKQYVLPVSFNLPAITFVQNQLYNHDTMFLADIETIRQEGISFNKQEGGAWVKLGFSPLWDKENAFIFLVASLFGAQFCEGNSDTEKNEESVQWNAEALQTALAYIRNWIHESTGSFQAEDDFIYKYFFDPPSKLLLDDYFAMDREKNTALDFRWLAYNDTIPVLENILSFGIYKNTRAANAAYDFARWLFSEQTQDYLLKTSFDTQLSGSVFGIAGGFSAMQTVTESIFPKYYKNLLGHIPPAALFTVPPELPVHWLEIKETVVLPYMLAEIRDVQKNNRSLPERFADRQIIKRGQF